MMDKKSEITVYVVVFIILLFYAGISIHEFLARDKYDDFLNSKIVAIENKISMKDSNLTNKDIDSLKQVVNTLYIFKNDLDELVHFGSGPTHIKIRKIRYAYCQEFKGIDEPYKDQSLSFLWFFILVWPNDILLIFTVIICGAMGAIIRAFIYKLEIKIYKIAIGITAAFIAYFAVKSGDFIFFDTENESSKLNPYTLSVIAVLSGIFSGKVFNYFKKKFFSDEG